MINKIVGALAIGGAAYLLRNEESRTKVINQMKNIASPENIEKIKSQFQSLVNQKSEGNPDEPKLVESLPDPAFRDYATTERAEAGRAY
ncbi:hypothetical protein [Neobacillus cucumis]|uniref:Uncharacterized protein n=1 Tax=Neobacillus cucumis TaxID=1740721 RepID=A0A2N5HCM3_9BACI|nr:hypothetical protein [Neobacillus cucumis]PLS03277.1 hypothetical protein CVD27_15535 [Neobacillus cucumis]